MQTQVKFCVCCSKINTLFFSGEPKHSLNPEVRTSLGTKKIILEIVSIRR